MNKDAVAEMSQQYQVKAAEKLVPVGYKQTEVGVTNSPGANLNATSGGPKGGGMDSRRIPEGWISCTLGDAITLQRGFDLPQRLRVFGKTPIVSSSGVTDFHNQIMVKAPGVVTGRYGTIGQMFYLSKDFWPLNTTLYVREFKKLTPLFTYYLLKTVDFISHSGKSGVPGVNRNDVHQEKILVPPKKEQTAIANALSDVDALLSELEKLIAKKQAIKTATMQQLLTGRTRLPQFAHHPDGSKKGYKQSELGQIPEDWDVRAIYELGIVDPENLPSTTNPDYEFKYISLEQVDTGVLLATTTYSFASAPSRARRVLRRHDVLLSTVRPNLMSHYFVQNEVNDLICSTGFSVIRCFEDRLVASYLYQHLFSTVINTQIDLLITGSNYPAINSSDTKRLKIQIGSIEEQTAIATILSDMDEEIQALEQRLNKTRQIKQGMMQQLLTGKIRLV